MSEITADPLEARVLVLAPTARDAEVTGKLLSGIGVAVQSFASLHGLCAEASRGAAALILTDSALGVEAMDPLLHLIEAQPPWSDLPILILTQGGAHSERGLLALERLGNVLLLDQPVRVAMLLSAVRGALRSRGRQYQLRAEIAAEQAAREALREADRRKDEFLATLGHELRNPLAAICNASYVLSQTRQDDPAVPRLHARIARQAEHLSRMVDDLLDVARITSGKIELRWESVDLLEVVRRAVETTEELILVHGHDFRQTLPEGPLWTYGDPARLEQVLINLLSNAVKYTEPGGRIDLEVNRDAECITISVLDSGIGISPPMLPRIFDLFAQADRARERSEGGLGIGLSLVRSLVELHGGTISVESEGVNRGSLFRVQLPLVEPALAPRERAPAESRPPEATRVLVVDDNADAGETLGEVLEMWGYPYRVTQSGPDALEAIPAFRPSIILLDLHMPGMTGWEVAERLADSPERDGFRLVALTGYGQAEDRERSRQAGFDEHLTKPVDPGQLRALLGRGPAGSAG